MPQHKNKWTKVSVIVPARDAAMHLGSCLKSLISQNLSCADLEIIVVNDSSSDNTAEIAKELGVTLLNSASRGAAAARNAGVAAASGDVLAFIDSDAVAESHWLESALSNLSEDCILVGDIKTVAGGEGGEAKLLASFDYSNPELVLGNAFLPFGSTCNMITTRAAYDALGGFSEKFMAAEDADFCWRALMEQKFSLKFCSDVQVSHSERSTSKSFLARARSHGRGQRLLAKIYEQRGYRGGFYLTIARCCYQASWSFAQAVIFCCITDIKKAKRCLIESGSNLAFASGVLGF